MDPFEEGVLPEERRLNRVSIIALGLVFIAALVAWMIRSGANTA